MQFSYTCGKDMHNCVSRKNTFVIVRHSNCSTSIAAIPLNILAQRQVLGISMVMESICFNVFQYSRLKTYNRNSEYFPRFI